MIILCDMIDRDEDKSKFARIYSLYKYTMYSVAYDISKCVEDAEDIVEESFIKVKYSLQGTTQGNGLTGGVPPVRFSM